jgi:hypothetical protein
VRASKVSDEFVSNDSSFRSIRKPTRFEVYALRLFAIGLLACGVWLAVPRRGHLSEELLSSCRLEKGEVARLFRGNGGVTTAFWYSVTVQPEMPWTEREVFHSYSAPALTGLSCTGDHVVVTSPSAAWNIDASDVVAGRSDPVTFSYGHEYAGVSRRGLSVSWLRIGLGLLFVLAGAFMLVQMRSWTRERTQPGAV